jgi:hypothetical protein
MRRLNRGELNTMPLNNYQLVLTEARAYIASGIDSHVCYAVFRTGADYRAVVQLSIFKAPLSHPSIRC